MVIVDGYPGDLPVRSPSPQNNPMFSVSHKCTVERTHGNRAVWRAAVSAASFQHTIAHSRRDGGSPYCRNKRICSRLRRSPPANAVGVSKSVCYFWLCRSCFGCRIAGAAVCFRAFYKHTRIFKKIKSHPGEGRAPARPCRLKSKRRRTSDTRHT